MENQVIINFNNEEYTATYNPQSGYYELDLTAPDIGGVYIADIAFTDLFLQEYEATFEIRVLFPIDNLGGQ